MKYYKVTITDITGDINITLRGIRNINDALSIIYSTKNLLFRFHDNYRTIEQIMKENPGYNEFDANDEFEEILDTTFFHTISEEK